MQILSMSCCTALQCKLRNYCQAERLCQMDFKIVINTVLTYFALLPRLSRNSKQINQSSVKLLQVHKTWCYRYPLCERIEDLTWPYLNRHVWVLVFSLPIKLGDEVPDSHHQLASPIPQPALSRQQNTATLVL